MRIEVFPPDNRRRDLDNLQKSLWDSLQHGGAYHDDSQVVRYEVEKFAVVPGGKVVVTIEERR
jgi:crossover junction endodeoxyribonuclease RusA